MGTKAPLSIVSPDDSTPDHSSSSSSSTTAALLPTTAALLPTAKPTSFNLSSFLLSTIAAVAVAAAFVFLFLSTATASSSAPSPLPHARPLSKLPRPVVLLVSSDGFRFGYQFKAPAPNLARLIANGTEAAAGLIPVFPTLTFPNHYSIATGLYPAHHGIINNYFSDPVSGDFFSMQSHDPKWWLGHPIWETVAAHGLPAATYFWPGSEVVKGNWSCPPNFCRHYNGSVPFEDRVDTVLSYFDLPADQIPVFMTLYFEDPDHQGHRGRPRRSHRGGRED